MDLSSNFLKYKTRNPFKHFLISQFFSRLEQLFSLASPQTVLDAGCGEGFVIQYLHRNHPKVQFSGIDKSEAAIELAKQYIPSAHLLVGDIFHLPFPFSSFDLVLCSEVLEHLKDPLSAILELSRVSKEYLLLTVPNEPWFSISTLLSGQYFSSLGRHPEHLQFWGKKQFVSLVEENFSLLSVTTSFPWTLVLCRRRN